MTWPADARPVDQVTPGPSIESGPRPGGVRDIRAIVLHMAEGGGTVQHLLHADGNSSHYVVEYTGRLVQMVREAHWAGSLNPRAIRTDDDKPYVYLASPVRYGVTAARATLGHAGARDPNRYVIAVEIEGYAKSGPNARQRRTLYALVNDIRRRRGALATLGHRDFQSYKACPGRRMPWVDYGGHSVKAAHLPDQAPPVTEDAPVKSFATPSTPTRALVNEGAWLYVGSDLQPHAANIKIEPGRSMPYLGEPMRGVALVEYVDSTGTPAGRAYFARADDVLVLPPAPAADDTCTDDLAAVSAALVSAVDRLAQIRDLAEVE